MANLAAQFSRQYLARTRFCKERVRQTDRQRIGSKGARATSRRILSQNRHPPCSRITNRVFSSSHAPRDIPITRWPPSQGRTPPLRTGIPCSLYGCPARSASCGEILAKKIRLRLWQSPARPGKLKAGAGGMGCRDRLDTWRNNKNREITRLQFPMVGFSSSQRVRYRWLLFHKRWEKQVC